MVVNHMKKTLSLVLIFVLLFSFPCFLFSAESSSVEKLNILGVLIGPGTGLTDEYLAKSVTRLDAAILVLKLKGSIDEAESYSGTDNFLDSSVGYSTYSKKIMGYLKSDPSVGFVGYLDRFDPYGLMSSQMIYKVLLEVLDYRQGVEFEWSETNVMAMLAGFDPVVESESLNMSEISELIVIALECEIKDSGVLLIEQLVVDGVLSLSLVHEAGWEYIQVD